MTLLDLSEDEVVEIRSLPADANMARRMSSLGLFAGRRIRFVKAAPFAGPLLVEDQATGARLMIARAMAGEVEVTRGRTPKP
ncbi:MAG: ferrous iron transport protein A [Deltaproteobacteria bacterium]|nr:ferrous iron transport protein A [Deltaproteobacteria bacterium]